MHYKGIDNYRYASAVFGILFLAQIVEVKQVLQKKKKIMVYAKSKILESTETLLKLTSPCNNVPFLPNHCTVQ